MQTQLAPIGIHTGTDYQKKRNVRVNLYRHADCSEEITRGIINSACLFTNFENLYQLFSVDMLKRENLLAEMLVKAGIISDADATAALSAAPDLTVSDYLRVNGHTFCEAFVTLADMMRSGRLSFNQAVVAANHVYMAGASIEDSLLLVKCRCKRSHTPCSQ